MNLFDLYVKITADAGEYEKAIKNAQTTAKGFATSVRSAASTAASTIESVFSTIAKVTTAAVGVASAGVVTLTKSAVDSYADYEQLVGGVETLFGDSANTVKKYALNAFSTAGMTANTYMETVTSFSASLLQGLGGDTEAAAEMANMAITDMADNANKMGTDLSAIQTAYQGFAKQNYTMLDNLKLGYGGTKEEMERLLKKADELSESFNLLEDENGELVYSFDDIVEAIHIVQDDMGIYGATSEEAAGTVSGSVATMKAAWQNLVGALGSGTSNMKWFINNFVESAKTAKDNILPVVENAMTGISELVDGLAPVITEAIPEIVTDVVPTLLQAGVDILVALVDGISRAVPTLLEKVPEIIRNFASTIGDSINVIWDAGTALVSELAKAIKKDGPQLISEAIDSLMEFLGEKLGISEDTLSAFEDTLLTAWETFGEVFEAIKTVIEDLVSVVEDSGITWEDVWVAIGDVIKTSGDAITGTIDLLYDSFEIVSNFVVENFGPAFETAKEKIEEAKEAVQPYIDALIDYVESGGLAEDITNALSDGLNAVKTAAEFVIEKVNQFSDWCIEHQGTIETIAIVVGSLATAIGLVSTAQALTNAITAIWTTVSTAAAGATTALGAAVTFLTSPLTILTAVIAAVIAIGVLLYKNWDTIRETAIELASALSEKFNEIKNNISESLTNAKESAVNLFEELRSGIEEKVNSAKETVSTVFEAIKSGIEEKINDAKDKVGEAIEKIKGFFDFEWSLPKLKLPHISITGGFSLSPLSVPKFSISWYKKAMDEAMLLDGATIFGAYGNTLLGGGEAGPEVVSGANTLMEMIREATGDAQGALLQIAVEILDILSEYFPEIVDNMTRNIVLDDGTLVGRLAPEIDEELGRLYRWNNR